MWKYLKHPNIVPLLGITVAPFQLISVWMSNGDLPGHIRRNPNADRLKLVGVHPIGFTPGLLLSPAVRHSKGPVLSPYLQCDSWGPQGSMWLSQTRFLTVLTPDQLNILMDASGNARIVDFGLATVTQHLDSIQSSCQRGHTPRWTAPEVLDGGKHSEEADIFAFAMVMVEVRHGCMADLLRVELWLIVISYQPRYSLVLSRLVIGRVLRP